MNVKGWKFATEAGEAHCKILWDHLHSLRANKMWESVVPAHDGKPWKVVQFWTTAKKQYIATIDLDTGGWDVFGQLDTTNQIAHTLKEIV